MNWFKRIALTLLVPLMLVAAGEAHARAGTTLQIVPHWSGAPTSLRLEVVGGGGGTCSLLATCSITVDFGSTYTLRVTTGGNAVIGAWDGLCAGAGTSSEINVTIPHNPNNLQCGIALGRVTTPTPRAGWWWTPGESGSGIALALNPQDRMFIAMFGYRDDGSPLWRVTTAIRTATPPSQRIYSATLVEMAGGGTLAGGEPIKATVADGSSTEVTITFSSGTQGQLTLKNKVTGAVHTKAIERFPINGQAVNPSPIDGRLTYWYVDKNQPDVGYFIEQQGTQAFIGTFSYDASGKPIWYISAGTVVKTAGGYQLEAPLNAFSGGSPFSAAPPVKTPTTMPAGTMLSNLSTEVNSAFLQLSTGRKIPLSFFAW